MRRLACIGEDCTIIGSACVEKKGKENAAHIGDMCELGMNCVVLGNVRIGNGVYIGARAIVTHSFEYDNISLAGVPAKIIKHNKPYDD